MMYHQSLFELEDDNNTLLKILKSELMVVNQVKEIFDKIKIRTNGKTKN
jgi:hypothetical protein